MKRLLLYGDNEIVETYPDYENRGAEFELLAMLYHLCQSKCLIIDTSKNLFFCFDNDGNRRVYDLTNPNLARDKVFRADLCRLIISAYITNINTGYSIISSNFWENDLHEYFSSIASNKKIRETIFKALLIERFSRRTYSKKCIYILDNFLDIISEIDTLTYKRYSMEVKLHKGLI